MISNVQRTIERLAPEMASYLQRKIFTKSEVDQIVERRRLFETKLERTNKRISDFIDYIKSEKILEKIRNRKIKKLSIGLEESDFLLSKNIVTIYSRGLHYFNDRILVEDFVDYCKNMKFYDEIKQQISKLCLKNMSDHKLWAFLGNVMFEMDDIEGARRIFISSISMITNLSSLLEIHLVFFEVECKYVQKLNVIAKDFEIDEDDKDDVDRGLVAFAVFKELIGIDSSASVIKKCLEIAMIVPGLDQMINNYKTES